MLVFTGKLGLDPLNLKATASDGVNEVSTTFSIDVQNEPPIISDISKLETEDMSITFTASDFTSHFSDVDGDSLTKIQVTSLPDNGTLKVLGVPVTLDQEILVGDLENLTFDPDAEWSGDTSFSWKGSDGAEYSAVAANVNIQITSKNDAPIVSDVSKSGTEDTTLTFTAEDFASHFSDVDGDSLTKIQVTSLPDNGVLKLSTVDVTLDQEILVGDLGSLTFDPDAEWSGDTSFSWKGHDGIEYSAAANVNITISAEQDSPIVSDVPKSGTEDTTLTFTASDFTDHFSDDNGDSLTKIQVTSLPANGLLKLSGVDVLLDQEIVVDDLENLTFDPDANWNGDTTFTWKGHDGIEYSAAAANVNITIYSDGNEPPIVSDVPTSGDEDTTLTFTEFDFTDHFIDVDGDSLTKIQITNLPNNGVLKLSGTPVTLNQEILVVDLGKLTFDPNTNWSGDTSFSWKGHDGTEYSTESASVNIHIYAVDDESKASTYSQWWML